jgi:hypothetical protein
VAVQSFHDGFDLQCPASDVRSRIEAAIAAADTVHGLPNGITRVAVVFHQANGLVLGEYRGLSNGHPVGLSIADQPPTCSALTFLHEAGHYLDHHALGAPGAISSGSSEWDDWRTTAQASEAAKQLREVVLSPTTKQWVQADGSTVAFTEDPTHAQYLLLLHEVFARSYCQFIVETSGDVGLLAELNLAKRLPYSEQWSETDFAPIRATFEAVFAKRGLLR